MISRMLIGAVHAIISAPLSQISCLLVLHSLTLALYATNTKLFKEKYYAAFLVAQAIFRVILIIFLLLEVVYEQ
jgi:hypothetical protein